MISKNEENNIYLEAKKRVDRYGHDGFFHYMMMRHDDIRKSFCQWMIPDCKIVETTVVNGEYYPTHNEGKKLILDILAKDEKGNLYNIEMQCYTIDKKEFVRFQLYAYRVLSDEVKKGISYSEVKPLRQMIINTEKPIEGFCDYIHQFVMCDKKTGKQMPYSLYEIYLVQLHYLDMEKIEIEEFDEFMYLFKNDKVYDKIKVHKNVQEAVTMHEEYLDSRERIAAIEREREEMIRRTREYMYKKAEEEAYTNGMEKGMAEGMEKGMAQGMAKIIITSLTQRLGCLSDSLLEDIQNLSSEQLEKLSVHLFDIKTEKDILDFIQ